MNNLFTGYWGISMKRFVVSLLLVLVGVAFAMPDMAFAQRRYKRRQYRRVKKRSTWAPVRRPRRQWQGQRRGVYLGVGLLGDFVIETDNDLSQVINTGIGGDVRLGFRPSNSFALELGGLLSIHDTDSRFSDHDHALLGGLSAEGKWFIVPKSRRIEPFVQLGLGYYWVWETSDWSDMALHGFGYDLGGGLDLRLSRVLTLGLSLLYKGMFMYKASDFDYTGDYNDEFAYLNHITAKVALQLRF